MFISRSGADKEEAAFVVQNLRGSGASVDVYRGDLGNEGDVESTVAEVRKTRESRCVVHAVMVLHVNSYLRQQMPILTWF